MKRYFEQLWFAPLAPHTLAACRMIVGGYAAYYLTVSRHWMVHSAGSSDDLFAPIGVTTLLDGPLEPSVLNLLIQAAILLAVAFAAGLLHRILAPIFAALFLFVVTYGTSWSMVYHTENMLVLHVIILALSPAASVLSLDSLYASDSPRLVRFGFSRPDATARDCYRWPVRLLQLGATLPYVVAGMAKLRGDAGVSWALGENLRDQITMNGLYYEVYSGGALPITFHVYGWDWAFMIAASLTLVLELGAPLALLHRYAGYLYVVGIMSMHWSILMLMGIPFPYQLYGFAFACFFNWEPVARFSSTRLKFLFAENATATD